MAKDHFRAASQRVCPSPRFVGSSGLGASSPQGREREAATETHRATAVEFHRTASPEPHRATAVERLRRRQAEARPIIDSLHGLLLEQKEKLLPKHPLALAIAYTLNQWKELTLFLEDGAVPIHSEGDQGGSPILAEQQMKRIALLRKNALFAGSPRGGETAAILSTITSTCRRHQINPQAYLTQLLANLPDTPITQLDQWLPDQWKAAQAAPTGTSPK